MNLIKKSWNLMFPAAVALSMFCSCGGDVQTIEGLSKTVDKLPEVKVRDFAREDFDGLCVDIVNGSLLTTSRTLDIAKDSQAVSVSGWALDLDAARSLGAMYVKVNEHIVEAEYGSVRLDVMNLFGLQADSTLGFTVTFPVEYLKVTPDSMAASVDFYMVSKTNDYMYQPVTFNVAYR